MKKLLLIPIATLLLLCSCEQDIPQIQGSYTLKYEGLEYEFVFIQTNSFEMGATSEQGTIADNSEYPVHSVQVGSYYIGVNEVTQGLWKAVMGDSLLDEEHQVLGLGDNLPVHNISWQQAVEFIRQLNHLTGQTFILPTEAEWEYAARGGVQENVYSGSSLLNSVCWNGTETVHRIRSKGSNNFGLYDMSGNVAEYCADWYGSYTAGNQIAPSGPTSGTFRVVRGGSIVSPSSECRVSARRRELPANAVTDCGFRLALK